MANKHGGKRKGSGRPTKGETVNIRKIFDEQGDLDAVVKALYAKATDGDTRAIDLILKYRVGLVKQEIDLNVDGQVDQSITLKGIIKFED